MDKAYLCNPWEKTSVYGNSRQMTTSGTMLLLQPSPPIFHWPGSHIILINHGLFDHLNRAQWHNYGLFTNNKLWFEAMAYYLLTNLGLTMPWCNVQTSRPSLAMVLFVWPSLFTNAWDKSSCKTNQTLKKQTMLLFDHLWENHGCANKDHWMPITLEALFARYIENGSCEKRE